MTAILSPCASKRQPVCLLKPDRPWNQYPLGTRARAFGGGAWFKTDRGWKWNGPDGVGGTFPTPGADAFGHCIELPIKTDGQE